ncbi:MAG: DUF5615 family PIN-like protein [Dehalococcoidia bacterium]|nr:DUF5615 family PIN-like protein [Dehalococcoidia bacterium]
MDQDSLDALVIAGLRRAGADVLSSADAGRQRAPDHEQLVFATAQERAIHTANRPDFARLHAEWMATGQSHWGVIIRSRQQISVREQIRLLVAAARQLTHDQWRDRILYL